MGYSNVTDTREVTVFVCLLLKLLPDLTHAQDFSTRFGSIPFQGTQLYP